MAPLGAILLFLQCYCYLSGAFCAFFFFIEYAFGFAEGHYFGAVCDAFGAGDEVATSDAVRHIL